jgi:hypothetical protein
MHHAVDPVERGSDTSNCRTQSVSAQFSTCLNEQQRIRCTYAFVLCDGYICTHPNHREFS